MLVQGRPSLGTLLACAGSDRFPWISVGVLATRGGGIRAIVLDDGRFIAGAIRRLPDGERSRLKPWLRS